MDLRQPTRRSAVLLALALSLTAANAAAWGLWAVAHFA